MNGIDKVVWRNDALWSALTGTDPDERKAALERALGEPCQHCNGTGSAETGTRHGGMAESIACDLCDGTGVAEQHPAAAALASRVVIAGHSHEPWCPKIAGKGCQCVSRRTDREIGVTHD